MPALKYKPPLACLHNSFSFHIYVHLDQECHLPSSGGLCHTAGPSHKHLLSDNTSPLCLGENLGLMSESQATLEISTVMSASCPQSSQGCQYQGHRLGGVGDAAAPGVKFLRTAVAPTYVALGRSPPQKGSGSGPPRSCPTTHLPPWRKAAAAPCRAPSCCSSSP